MACSSEHAPVTLRVVAPAKPRLAGDYVLLGGVDVNGHPVWGSGTHRLYATSFGNWGIGYQEDSPAKNTAWIVSRGRIGTSFPHQMHAWKYNDGTQWIASPEIAIIDATAAAAPPAAAGGEAAEAPAEAAAPAPAGYVGEQLGDGAAECAAAAQPAEEYPPAHAAHPQPAAETAPAPPAERLVSPPDNTAYASPYVPSQPRCVSPQRMSPQQTVGGPALDPGARVQRNPRHWTYGDQDGGEGGEGTVVVVDALNGWAKVRWDTGGMNSYRWGYKGAWDLCIVGGVEVPTLLTATQKDTARLEERIIRHERVTEERILRVEGQLREQLDAVRGDNAALTHQCAELRQQNAALEASHARLEQAHLQACQTTSDMQAQLQEQCRQLQSELAASQQQQSSLTEQCREMQSEVAQLEGMRQAQEELRAQCSEMHSEVATLDALREKVQVLNGDHLQLRSEHDALRADHKQLLQGHEGLKSTCEGIQREYRAMVERMARLESALGPDGVRQVNVHVAPPSHALLHASPERAAPPAPAPAGGIFGPPAGHRSPQRRQQPSPQPHRGSGAAAADAYAAAGSPLPQSTGVPAHPATLPPPLPSTQYAGVYHQPSVGTPLVPPPRPGQPPGAGSPAGMRAAPAHGVVPQLGHANPVLAAGARPGVAPYHQPAPAFTSAPVVTSPYYATATR